MKEDDAVSVPVDDTATMMIDDGIDELLTRREVAFCFCLRVACWWASFPLFVASDIAEIDRANNCQAPAKH